MSFCLVLFHFVSGTVGNLVGGLSAYSLTHPTVPQV